MLCRAFVQAGDAIIEAPGQVSAEALESDVASMRRVR